MSSAVDVHVIRSGRNGGTTHACPPSDVLCPHTTQEFKLDLEDRLVSLILCSTQSGGEQSSVPMECILSVNSC